jgi:hypothetical protein
VPDFTSWTLQRWTNGDLALRNSPVSTSADICSPDNSLIDSLLVDLVTGVPVPDFTSWVVQRWTNAEVGKRVAKLFDNADSALRNSPASTSADIYSPDNSLVDSPVDTARGVPVPDFNSWTLQRWTNGDLALRNSPASTSADICSPDNSLIDSPPVDLA